MRKIQSLLSMMFVLIICLAQMPVAYGDRIVTAEIILDGKVLLVGNTSDDGSRDADELWDELKSIRFKATAEFRKLNIKEDAKQAVIISNAPKSERVNLRVELRYGGDAIAHKIQVNRVPVDDYGREWQIDAADVTRLFDRRMISRAEAAKLVNQKRKE